MSACFRRLGSRILRSGSSGKRTAAASGGGGFGPIEVSAQVQGAMANGCPVVVLESTIITHGMPYPENVETALKVEQAVRDHGATPATVAILDGVPLVGLSEDQLHSLADSRGQKSSAAIKASRRDIPVAMAQGLSAGTTVSGTMVLANKVGLPLFVTGGLGGVHRGAESSMDISCDLTELGKTPMAVVSAGVKSFLDIAKTLEYLETQGVCVATYGRSAEFPAFFTPRSGVRAPHTFRDAREAASVVHQCIDVVGSGSGLLIGVPIPSEGEAQAGPIEEATRSALEECRRKGITGKDLTPYVLARIAELSQGDSLRANISLILNNARVGAMISAELARLRSSSSSRVIRRRGHHPSQGPSPTPPEGSTRPARGLVVGACNFDLVWSAPAGGSTPLLMNGTSNDAKVSIMAGGVGRGICAGLGHLGTKPSLVSVVGNDPMGDYIMATMPDGVDTSHVLRVNDASTPAYTLVLDNQGEAKLGLMDRSGHSAITKDLFDQAFFQEGPPPADSRFSYVVFDGNIPGETMDHLLERCLQARIPAIFEPTNWSTAHKPLMSQHRSAIRLGTPNFSELQHLHLYLAKEGHSDSLEQGQLGRGSGKLEQSLIYLKTVSQVIPVLLVGLGKDGALLAKRGSRPVLDILLDGAFRQEEGPELLDSRPDEGGDLVVVHYPVEALEEVESVSGAGDSMTSAFIAGIFRGVPEHQSVAAGLQAARLSLKCKNLTIPPGIGSVSWDRIPRMETLVGPPALPS